MDQRRQHLTVLHAMSMLSLCCLLANMNSGNALPKNSFLMCALDCLQSPRCGWIVMDQILNQCYAKTSLDCSILENGTLQKFRRVQGQLNFEAGMRDSTFELMDAAYATCTTSTTSCEIPAAVANADVQYGALFPDSVATYNCYDGFSFCGLVQRKVACLANGSWEELGSSGCYRDTWTSLPSSEEPLLCPVTFGTVIEITGVPTKNTSFAFNLLGEPQKIVLHISVRFTLFSTNLALCTSRAITGVWSSDEIIATTFPFEVGRQFDLTVVVYPLIYSITVDGNHLMTCNHWYPVEDIRSFVFLNDISLIRIKYSYN